MSRATEPNLEFGVQSPDDQLLQLRETAEHLTTILGAVREALVPRMRSDEIHPVALDLISQAIDIERNIAMSAERARLNGGIALDDLHDVLAQHLKSAQIFRNARFSNWYGVIFDSFTRGFAERRLLLHAAARNAGAEFAKREELLFSAIQVKISEFERVLDHVMELPAQPEIDALLSQPTENVAWDDLVDRVVGAVSAGADIQRVQIWVEQAGHDTARLAAVGELATRTAELRRARQAQESAVYAARNASASWSDVGKATDMSGPGAMRRWDAEAKERNRKYAEERRNIYGDVIPEHRVSGQ